jgi:hypothetical protein
VMFSKRTRVSLIHHAWTWRGEPVCSKRPRYHTLGSGTQSCRTRCFSFRWI